MGHALFFAFDDEANCGALHATSGESAVDLAPQDRRHLISIETVEDSACFGSVHQLVVDSTRVGEGVLDGGLGDLVEHHAVHGDLRLQIFLEVGGNGLPLAVFVGGEIEGACILEERLQVLDDRCSALGQLVVRLEAVLDVDGETFAWQVGNVADRCANVESITEIFGDRFRLGGGLDDD